MKVDEIQQLGPVSSRDQKRLAEVTALVGVVGDVPRKKETYGSDGAPGYRTELGGDQVDSSSEAVHERIRLVFGGLGRIEERHTAKKEKKKEIWKNREKESNGVIDRIQLLQLYRDNAIQPVQRRRGYVCPLSPSSFRLYTT